jgi:hypothetical protein
MKMKKDFNNLPASSPSSEGERCSFDEFLLRCSFRLYFVESSSSSDIDDRLDES